MVRSTDGNSSKLQDFDILFIVNGEKMPKDFDLNSLDTKKIKSMEVLKTEDALKEYGAEGKDGVIKITLKEE